MTGHPMTKTAFLLALNAEVQRLGYAWTADTELLAAFMDRARNMLATTDNTMMIKGPAFTAAWRAIGGKGKPTYKALRALPSGRAADEA